MEEGERFQFFFSLPLSRAGEGRRGREGRVGPLRRNCQSFSGDLEIGNWRLETGDGGRNSVQ